MGAGLEGSGRPLVAFAVVALLGCPAEPEPEPELLAAFPTVGPHAVGHAALDIEDPDRGRTLPTQLWYPVDPADAAVAEPADYPLGSGFAMESEVAVQGAPVAAAATHLLVFSHGYGGIATQSTALVESLASHGFVVASPEHVGNSQDSPDDDFDTAARNRVPDVVAVIDALQAQRSDPEALLFDRIGAEAVGVLGHSFGGMTAIGAAAGWAEAAPDPRVAAIAPISAVIDGDLQADDRPSPFAGFDADQLGAIDVPVLLVGGTQDVSVPIENNRIALPLLTGAPFAASAEIEGANHTHFAGVCAIGDFLIELGFEPDVWAALGAGDLLAPYAATCSEDAFPVEEAIRLSQTLGVAFFSVHLRGEDTFAPYLSGAYAAQEPDLAWAAGQ